MVKLTQTGGTNLDNIVNAVIPPATVSFLNTPLYTARYAYFNYWSIIHFGIGMLFYRYFSKNFKLWLKINIAFEVFEFILAWGGHPLFVEELVDIVWDVIISMAGFLVMKYYTEGKLR